MSGNEKMNRAFGLSLIAGILILANAASVGAAATWFPWIIPTLPGSSGNDPIVLIGVATIGLICGAIILLGALMLRLKPTSKKLWGIIIIVFSTPSVITGGGFIIGFILGIVGGATALKTSKPK